MSKASNLDETVDNETLSDASEALNKIGIQVYETSGEYREFDVIMGELAEKWDTLTDAQQANISFAIAATRQTNTLKAILNSYSESMELASEATESEGNAMKNQNKYADTYQGKLQEISDNMQSFAIDTLETDGIKTLLNLVKELAELLDGISSKGGLSGLLTFGAGALSLGKIGLFTNQNGAVALNGKKLTSMGADFKQGTANIGLMGGFKNAFSRNISTDRISNLQTVYSNYLNAPKGEVMGNSISGFSELNSVEKDFMITQSRIGANQNQFNNTLAATAKQTTGLKAAVSSLSATISSVVLNMAIVWAITKVVSVVSELINYSDDLNERFQELGSNLSETNKTITNYKSQVKSLNATIQDESSSTEEVASAREQLLDLQNELIDNYGSEVGNINLVTSSFDEQLSVLNEIAKSEYWEQIKEFNSDTTWIDKLNLALRGEDSLSQAAIKNIEDFDNYHESNYFNPDGIYDEDASMAMYVSGSNDLDEYLRDAVLGNDKELRGIVNKYFKATDSFGYLDISSSDVFDYIDQIEGALSDLGTHGYSDTDLYKLLESRVTDLEAEYGDQEDLYDAYQRVKLTYDKDANNYYEQLESLYSDYETASTSGTEEELKNAEDAFNAKLKELDESTIDESLKSWIEREFSNWKDNAYKYKFTVDIVPTIDNIDGGQVFSNVTESELVEALSDEIWNPDFEFIFRELQSKMLDYGLGAEDTDVISFIRDNGWFKSEETSITDGSIYNTKKINKDITDQKKLKASKYMSDSDNRTLNNYRIAKKNYQKLKKSYNNGKVITWSDYQKLQDNVDNDQQTYDYFQNKATETEDEEERTEYLNRAAYYADKLKGDQEILSDVKEELQNGFLKRVQDTYMDDLTDETNNYENIKARAKQVAQKWGLSLQEALNAQNIDTSNFYDQITELNVDEKKREAKAFASAFTDLKTTTNSDYQSLYSDLTSLAEAGNLTVETFSDKSLAKNATEWADEMGISVENAVQQINDLIDRSKELSSMETATDSLHTAWAEKEDDGIVSASTLSGMYDTFGIKDTSSKKLKNKWDEYQQIAGDSSSSMSDIKNAQDDLITAWVNSGSALDGLVDETGNCTESNKQYYISQLKEMDVTNAEEVVTKEIEKQKRDLYLTSLDLTDATDGEISAVANSIVAYANGDEAILKYQLAKIASNGTNIESPENIDRMIAIGKQIGLNTKDLLVYYNLKRETEKYEYALSIGDQGLAQSAQKLIEEYKLQIQENLDTNLDFTVEVGGGKDDEDNNETFDWIEKRLDRLERKTTEVVDKITAYIGKKKKEGLFEVSIVNMKAEVDAAKKATNAYLAEFNKSVKKNGLSANDVYKIKNGQYSIEEVSNDDRADGISEAMDIWEKYLEARERQTTKQNDLDDQIKEYYDSRVQDIEDIQSNLEHTADMIQGAADINQEEGSIAGKSYYNSLTKNGNQQIKNLQNEKNLELQYMSTLDKTSDEYAERQQKVNEIDKSIQDITKSQAEWNNELLMLPITKLENAASSLESYKSLLEQIQSLNEAKGISKSYSDYQDIISNAKLSKTFKNNEIKTYYENIVNKATSGDWKGMKIPNTKKAKNALTEAINNYTSDGNWSALVASLKKLGITEDELVKSSEENGLLWYINQIVEGKESVASLQTAIEEAKESAKRLNITKFENIAGVIDQIKSNLESIVSFKESLGYDKSDESIFKELLGGEDQITAYSNEITALWDETINHLTSGDWGFTISKARAQEFKEIYYRMLNGEIDESTFESEIRKLTIDQDKLNEGVYEEFKQNLDDIADKEQAIIDKWTEQEELLDELAQKRIDAINEYVDDLEEANDQRSKAIELEKAEQKLQEAKQNKTSLVYHEGYGFVYEADQSAINEAQNELDDLQFEALIDSLKDIADKIQEAVDNGDINLRDELGNIKTSVKETVDEYVQALTKTITGMDLQFTLSEDGKRLSVSSVGSAYATGTSGVISGGRSLVGELGSEMLVRDGQWNLIGANGAEFIDTKPGDIIFDHKKTADLLKNGAINQRGKAFANGTGNVTTMKKVQKSFTGGTVLPSHTTYNNLFKQLSTDIDNYTKSYESTIASAINSKAPTTTYNLTMQNVEISGVNDAQSLVNELISISTTAYQQVNKR